MARDRTWGGWRAGRLVLADPRGARLGLSWSRGGREADLPGTLARAGRKLAGDHPGADCQGQRYEGDRGFAAWRSADGDRHVAVRVFPGATLVWRQLAPDAERALEQQVAATTAAGDGDAATWRLHGLDLDLPPWWRLEGVQHVAGLTRGLWCRYPDGRRAPDQLLVVRRMACPDLVLAGRPLGAWLAGHLRPGETADVADADGACSVDGTTPGRTWWRRIRGRHDRRRLHAWIDEPAQRLLVQEWKGEGEPLPCLRRADPARRACA